MILRGKNRKKSASFLAKRIADFSFANKRAESLEIYGSKKECEKSVLIELSEQKGVDAWIEWFEAIKDDIKAANEILTELRLYKRLFLHKINSQAEDLMEIYTREIKKLLIL